MCAADALVYRGPTKLPLSSLNQRIVETELKYTSLVTTSGSGQLIPVFGNAPTNASDWSNLIASFDEYRTLSMVVAFIPKDRYTHTNVAYPVSVVVDNDSSGALSSHAGAAAYESFKLVSLEVPFKTVWKMSGVTQATWITTASPTSNAWIKWYSDTLSNSSDYGRFVVSYLVQFRGRN